MSSISNFEPSKISDFGAMAQDTIAKMERALNGCNEKLKLIYNKKEMEFTILNSKDFDNEFIQRLISFQGYKGWKPEIKDKTDEQGNKIVKMIAVRTIYPQSIRPYTQSIRPRADLLPPTDLYPLPIDLNERPLIPAPAPTNSEQKEGDLS